MTQEDKKLLLKDLCARLPYGVIAYASEVNKNGIVTDVNIPYNMTNLTVDNNSGKYELVSLSDIKPYLRPISSMTNIEEDEYMIARYKDIEDAYIHLTPQNAIDWLNSHHFDYRRLIEKGLALEAPERMYKTE